MSTLGIFFSILGSLGVFLFGMKVMSEGIQKVAGEKLRHIMAAMTRNRFFGVGTGTLVTAMVQSSSATTVMVVSFVNARLLTLRESISVIMGANLGTTFTFFIISYMGIKFSLSSWALPIIGIGLLFLFWKNARSRDLGETLIGFGLLFMGLELLKQSVPDVQANSEALAFIQNFTGMGYLSILIFMVFGILLTITVQSSSVAGAITLMMAFKGWIDYETAAAVILGENIGTTITANIAAIGANANAKRAARAHLIFNLIGVAWMFFLLPYFIGLIGWIHPVGTSGTQGLAENLAWFHFSFNFLNICLLIGFIPLLEKIVVKLTPDDKTGSESHLIHISSNALRTGELDLVEAQKEVIRLAELSESMFKGFLEIYSNPDKDMGKLVKEVRKQEELSDKITYDLINYLIHCSTNQLGDQSATKVVAMTQIASELEDICDWCKRLVDHADRRYRKNRFMPEETDREVIHYGELVLQFLQFFRTRLHKRITPADMEQADMLEKQIDTTLKRLRKKAIKLISASGEIKAGLLHIDILSQMEKIGNHALNILQALRKQA